MRESKGACPNPNCLSRGTDDHQLMPMDFLRVSKNARLYESVSEANLCCDLIAISHAFDFIST